MRNTLTFAWMGPLLPPPGHGWPPAWICNIRPQPKVTSAGVLTDTGTACPPGKLPVVSRILNLFLRRRTKTVFDTFACSRDCTIKWMSHEQRRYFLKPGLLFQFNKQNWECKVVQSALAGSLTPGLMQIASNYVWSWINKLYMEKQLWTAGQKLGSFWFPFVFSFLNNSIIWLMHFFSDSDGSLNFTAQKPHVINYVDDSVFALTVGFEVINS